MVKFRAKKRLGDLYELPRGQKALLLIVLDAAAAVAGLYLAYALRLGELDILSKLFSSLLFFAAVPVICVGTLLVTSFYRMSARSMGRQAVVRLALAAGLSTLALLAIAFMLPDLYMPRSVPPIYGVVLFMLLGGVRFGIQGVFQNFISQATGTEPVLIYGAGDTGQQLLAAARHARGFDVVAFVDDDSRLQGTIIDTYRVHRRSDIPRLIERGGVKRILVAMPNITPARQKELLEYLKQFDVRIQMVPSIANLVLDAARIETTGLVDVDTLLERETVDPHRKLLEQAVAGKVVVVTGAGGSIGSELARQALSFGPKKLVLFEHSENALYEIERELGAVTGDVPVVAVLGSIINYDVVLEAFKKHSADIVFHAAAYKHVPIVQSNSIAAIRNNVMGTYNVARAVAEAGVRQMVHISTDKAVRPAGTMGVTKRLSELVVQYWHQRGVGATYSAVRFGNVLGSSGSVIPLFTEQIARGGPITVTHPDVYRYFMTIPEAAQLVIQSAELCDGGDIFLLEMGKEVRILDVAKRMLALHGLTEKTDENPDGDIEIKIVGLRPGERLREELLVVDGAETTDHPKIWRSREPLRTVSAFEADFDKLTAFVANLQADNALALAENMLAADKESNQQSGAAE